MAVTTDSSTCSRSALVAFTFPLTKRHPVNISFLKNSATRYRVTIGVHVITFTRTRTHTYISFSNKTQVQMFYFLSNWQIFHKVIDRLIVISLQKYWSFQKDLNVKCVNVASELLLYVCNFLYFLRKTIMDNVIEVRAPEQWRFILPTSTPRQRRWIQTLKRSQQVNLLHRTLW